MSEQNDVYLMYVEGSTSTNSNKYYNMFPNGDSFRVEYGRMGSTKTTYTYSMSQWGSKYRSKIRKGYTDISDLKSTQAVVAEASGNKSFDSFYEVFRKYTGDLVKKTYLAEGCSQGQIDEAQSILNALSGYKKVNDINDKLVQLYKVIPRRMADVRNHLISDVSSISQLISQEQDALDSMDSSNIMNVSNPFKELGVDFKEVTNHKKMEDLLYPTMGSRGGYGASRNAKIHKVYAINDKTRTKEQEDWLTVQDDKSCELLIHGTRCPNIFSILKSGLLIRPSNAYFSGAAYGDGVYHSAHSAKSLGYVGYDTDKLFLIQNVHMGNSFKYQGYYRQGKSLSRSDMNYDGLRRQGNDSLFVQPGDGLLNSEYIIFKKEQTNTKFLVWMK